MTAIPLQIDIDRLVRKFVSLASGMPSEAVIPGNDPHPAPSGSYATVLELAKIGVGVDSEVAGAGPSATEATLHHKGTRSIRYSVQFYRAGASDFVEGLLSYTATTPGQIWLAENGLTWQRAGDVTTLDSVIDTKFEQRRAVDITFKYQSVRTVDINRIGSVEIGMSLSAESDLTETLEITDA